MEEGYGNAVHAVEMMISGEIQAAMNEYQPEEEGKSRE